MNLRALQYIDVYKSVTSAICSRENHAYSSRLRLDNSGDEHRYIVIECARKSPRGAKPCNFKTSNPILLKARPVFPNSLLSTEVCVSLPMANAIPNTTRIMDTAYANNLYHRLHDPLPESLGHQLYRSANHIVIILENETRQRPPAPELLHTLDRLLNIQLQPPRKNRRLEVPLFLENHLKICSWRNLRSKGASISAYRLTHPLQRLNVIGKSSLVMCDTAGIAVDSLRSSVPVMFLSEIPIGFESLQNYFENFLNHGDKSLLLNQQTAALGNILKEQCTNHFVMNNHHTLKRLVQFSTDAVNHEPSDDRVSYDFEQNITSEGNLILNTQQNFEHTYNSASKFKSGLENSRRKLQKFKESPKRFMEDSQIGFIRSMAVSRNR